LWFEQGREFNVADFLFNIKVLITVYCPYLQIPELNSFAEEN